MHLQENGFRATVRDTALHVLNAGLNVPDELGSCHTALVGNYRIVGHVPAHAIRRLLRERPADIAGLSVPGMPIGSPGMEVPGRPAQRYNIMAWDREGRTRVYERR